METNEIKSLTRKILIENGVDEKDIVVQCSKKMSALGETHYRINMDDEFVRRSIIHGVPMHCSPMAEEYVEYVKRELPSARVEKIVFSNQLLEMEDYACENIIKHECAHFLLTYFTKRFHDHDELWKQWVEFLGGNPTVYASLDEMIPKNAKYVIVCTKCNRHYCRQRRSKIVQEAEVVGACPVCGGRLHAFTYEEVKKYVE